MTKRPSPRVSSGDGNPNPALRVRLTFAALSGAIAAVMLGVGNSEQGMKALQTMAILVALPFSIIMVLMCVFCVNPDTNRMTP